MPRRAVLALAVLLAGCVSSERRAPLVRDGAAPRLLAARRVAVAVDASAREVSEGISYESPAAGEAVAARVSGALAAELAPRGLAAVPLSAAADPELRDVVLLFVTVVHETKEMREVAPEGRPRRFDLGVGPVGPVLDRAGADLLVVAVARSSRAARSGPDRCATDGAYLGLGVVDRDGALLWLADRRRPCAASLADPRETAALVRELLAELRGGAR